MMFHGRKNIVLACALTVLLSIRSFCNAPEEMHIIGGGMAGGMEAYCAHLDAKESKRPLRIKVWEKNASVSDTTVANIVPSLTCDEIVSVVPRGPELVKKLAIRFNNPGGIRVDDVEGINATAVTEGFKQEAQIYSLNEEGHKQRTQDLLALGKMSMEQWQELYDTGDAEFKKILEESNFNPCREPLNKNKRQLHDGYRVDLIYNVPNAHERALGMQRDYEALGYKHCTILTPADVMAIDPYLTDFCTQHSTENVWHHDAVALWRPGGCIDAQILLPKLHAYLTKVMGTYTDTEGKQHNCFQVHYGKKVTGIEFAKDVVGNGIVGLTFEDGQTVRSQSRNAEYVFCPGEAVGTLKRLGLAEPAYAGFAGVSLLLNIDIPQDKAQEYAQFSHCMEVHQEGVVLAWQARIKNNKIFIGVAGTKAFYSDQRPTKEQEFARNRNLLQLNMINDVLPQFVSLALNYDTKGKTLTEKDLNYLEERKIATRWAGVRAVVYDGFPTLGAVYKDGVRVENARCTTHLGSGGASFSPAVVALSRKARANNVDAFTGRILKYGSSARNSEVL
jgi:hypothetical protein